MGIFSRNKDFIRDEIFSLTVETSYTIDDLFTFMKITGHKQTDAIQVLRELDKQGVSIKDILKLSETRIFIK